MAITERVHSYTFPTGFASDNATEYGFARRLILCVALSVVLIVALAGHERLARAFLVACNLAFVPWAFAFMSSILAYAKYPRVACPSVVIPVVSIVADSKK